MKKVAVVAALTGWLATVAYAAPTAAPGTGVVNSVHDMNVIDGLAKDPQGRVCAFCHTPHHALDNNTVGDYNPLWSHNMTAMTNPTPYQNSTFDATGALDPLAGPSRLCMSCHDGIVAPDQHYGGLFAGTSNLGGKFQGDTFGDIAVGFNGDFSNDHPIGFDVTESASDAGIWDFWTDQTVESGLKFLGIANTRTGALVAEGLHPVAAGAAGTIFTCATCHDVHNKDNAPNTTAFSANHAAGDLNYLIYSPQSGSMLCLSCHKK